MVGHVSLFRVNLFRNRFIFTEIHLDLSNDSLYRYFLDNLLTQDHQSVVVGLRELRSNESCSMTPPMINDKYNFTSNYNLRVFTSTCYYFDEKNQWKSDGLLVGPSTTMWMTQCFSSHLTKFASGLTIIPESIDWRYVFANAGFNRNKTIYVTIIVIVIIYLLLMIYSKYKDRKDVEKLGVTPLGDNQREDQYLYQVIVFTGQRKDSGTKSRVRIGIEQFEREEKGFCVQVHLILYGEDEQTTVRMLVDPRRAILQRGGIDAFLLAVPK